MVTGYSINSHDSSIIMYRIGVLYGESIVLRNSLDQKFDIKVTDVDSALEQVVALGGTHLETIEENGSRWIVVQDPDGNEFCLVRETP